jgi:hypothetical protein
MASDRDFLGRTGTSSSSDADKRQREALEAQNADVTALRESMQPAPDADQQAEQAQRDAEQSQRGS